MNDDSPERIWHTVDRRGKISGVPDAHVKPCAEVEGAYQEYIRADLAKPTVKPLEWYPSPDEDTDFCADALGVTYVVDCDLDGLCSWGFFRKVGREEFDDDWSIDDAKAAAQDDYERRILSALK